MNFYTNVQVHSGRILYRGVENGNRVKKKLSYQPTLYVKSTNPSADTDFRTIDGHPLTPMEFKSIREAKDFIYSHNEAMQIFGMRRFEYSYIDQHCHCDHWDKNLIAIARIDIEVKSDNGFPHPSKADEEITLITYKLWDRFYSFGLGEFKTDREDIEYVQCANEFELLSKFMFYWKYHYPDIVTGWNIHGFDIPYLVNRIRKVLGEDVANDLSPWGVIKERKFRDDYDRSSYDILGISIIDSQDTYKKYAQHGGSQDSYALNNIANIELGVGKLDYSEVGSLTKLYETNFQKYVEYNIQDIEIDEGIAKKYDILSLMLTVAYMNGVNYDDVMQQVRMWAAIVDREYKKEKVILEHGKSHAKLPYEGAFVKDPQVGAFDDIVSYDLTSLYPHLFMQYNVSPETLVKPENYTPEMWEFLKQEINVDTLRHGLVDTSILKKLNLTVTPNKQLFRIDKEGVMPRIMREMYQARADNKKRQIAAEKARETATEPAVIDSLEYSITKYQSLQSALKVCLNSAYGASGSEYFVLFDSRLAEAITMAGQLSIHWVGDKTDQAIQAITGNKTKSYILAQDTDSMYLTLTDMINAVTNNNPPTDINERIDLLDKLASGIQQKIISKSFEDLKEYVNAPENRMFMKREVLGERGFWTGKKRYAVAVWDKEGVRYDHAKVKITGLEAVRSSTPIHARLAIKKLCEIVLIENTKKAAIDFVEKFHSEFSKQPLDRIAITTGVKLNKYESAVTDSGGFGEKTPMHVRAAIVYNQFIKKYNLEKKYDTIKEGNKIRYVFLKMPNPAYNNVFAWETVIPEELEIEKYVDYESLYDRTFYNPAKKIIEAFGWQPHTSLEDFFS